MNKNGELVISIENYLLKSQLENAISYLVEKSNELAKSLRELDELEGKVDFEKGEVSDIESQLEYINLILEPYEVNNLRHLFASLYIRFEDIKKQRQRILDEGSVGKRNSRQIEARCENLNISFGELNQEFLAFYQVVTRAYGIVNSRRKAIDCSQDGKPKEQLEQKHRFLNPFHKK